MKEDILNFPRQFSYNPEVQNRGKLKSHRNFVVAGMGGSHLAADLLKTWDPEIDLTIHSDYGLPRSTKETVKQTLVIANSYSGNTEETISAFESARKSKLPLIAVTTGGKLLSLAKKHQIPHIVMPQSTKEPRTAIGTSFAALLQATNNMDGLRKIRSLPSKLSPQAAQEEAKGLAKAVAERITIIYSSGRNYPLAYFWKISMNETAKTPAFANVFPELNHNEINSFSQKTKSSAASPFYFIFLEGKNDPAKIGKRMEITDRLLTNRNWPVKKVNLGRSGSLEDIFQNILLAMWSAYFIAEKKGVDPDKIEMVEELKRLIGK